MEAASSCIEPRREMEESTFDIDKAQVVVSDDPEKIYEEYRYLRKHCPLAHTTQYGGYWLLTRYADVKRAALDSATYISSVQAVVPSDPRGIRRPPLNFDAPAHTPFRTALARTLKPARLERLAGPLQGHAEAQLRPLLDAGGGDVAAGFGARYVARRGRDAATVTANSLVMYQIARDLLADRRATPRDPEEDPASSLLLERDAEGNPLSEEHLVGCLRQSLVVGVVAPPILIGSICKHLAEDKALQRRLRGDESLLPAALEEFVRLYSPYRGFARTVSRDVSFFSYPRRDDDEDDDRRQQQPPAATITMIRPGEPVTLHYTSANRDPDVFARPDDFVLHRDNVAMHMGFGRGRHRCVGMPLARLALETALKVILRSTKDFEVDGPLQYSRMPELGIISCPMRFFCDDDGAERSSPSSEAQDY
ncbi:uncharacterized protein PG998_004374 [Apiospora kogelbergensis]|uniref:uncharacterized protein n=1 Tax=Apiospora kogelbergensis TaxID=1337665 RepID=UPI003130A22D